MSNSDLTHTQLPLITKKMIFVNEAEEKRQAAERPPRIRLAQPRQEKRGVTAEKADRV
ncbi:MAG: hypothetical protein GTN76_00480 [Candidatus Aenigmarchaeota archaeon]|nr:hypothetical protein [Candidatus Aenigmarchaeota archaeon]